MKRSNPLVTVRMSQPNQISLNLKEPLRSKTKKPSRISQELELLKKLSHLELMLEKLNRLELWKDQSTVTDPTIKKLQQSSSQLENELQKDTVLKSELLDREKIKELYPNAFAILFKETPTSPSVSDQSYPYSLTNLDQIYTIACRLYHDLRILDDHTYISYQLALLYQCINRQGVTFINYKERIERKFEEIRKATTYDQKRLGHSTISWLQSLTLDIIMQVTEKASILKCDPLFQLTTQLVNMHS